MVALFRYEALSDFDLVMRPAARGSAAWPASWKPRRQRLGRLGNGELFLVADNRANSPKGQPHPRLRSLRRVRLHRALLQSAATPLKAGYL